MVDEQKEARLNEIAIKWKTTQSAGNEAVLAALKNELWILSFELFDPTMENFRAKRPNKDREWERASMVFLDVFEEVCAKYSPDRGPFVNYLSYLLKRRLVSAYEAGNRNAPDGVSIDKEREDEDGGAMEQSEPSAPLTDDPDWNATFDSYLAELTAMILNFSERHKDKTDNKERRMWYRLFYTENMTLAAQTTELSLHHERDIFTAMKLPYLDYYMSKVCRTIHTLSHTPLKPYEEVVLARKGKTKETKLPLPADVSLSYLQICENISVGESARSNQMKGYKEEIKAMLRC